VSQAGADSSTGRPHLPDVPFVSVVVPVLNEERHIADCLASVVVQTYPHDRMEVIVADGGSTDATRQVVERLSRQHPFIRLIDNPRRIQAAGLNAALAVSRGEVIARLDGHAAWRPGHVARCVELLRLTGADNVGGSMESLGDTAVAEAIGCATASPFGVGGARYRYATSEQDVDTVWLGCFRRSALERVGGYDESLAVHEDYELNHRIRASGGRVVFSPDLATIYRPRSSWSSLWRQFFRYGRAKAEVARRDPGVMRPHHLVPPALIAAAPLLAAAASQRRTRGLTVALGATYASACIAAASVAARERPLPVRARTAVVFPVLHVAWGLGFWDGLVRR
jgi:succinoglycan biosynthesis protein ExoA